jgi:hypothetical protein
MNIFLAPHNDDETLFGAFTISREKPLVIVVFDPHPRSGDPDTRMNESSFALTVLGAKRFIQGSIEQDPADARVVSHEKVTQIQAMLRELDEMERPERVWAPATEPCGNAEHVAVGEQARVVFGDRVTHYHTYHAGKKVALGVQVAATPVQIRLKLLALAAYKTQHERATRHFLEDLREWYA